MRLQGACFQGFESGRHFCTATCRIGPRFANYTRSQTSTALPMMYWLLLLIVPMILGIYAQMKVSSAYHKNLQIPSRGRITGAEAAQAVMDSAGINDVEIVEV